MGEAEPVSAWLPTRLGRYTVLGELATGGMAQILLARLAGPSGFERLVVLKRILPHLRKDESFVRMFLDEARIVAGIHHANVVQVHELEREGSELYLVMEYLRGESLMSVMRRLQRFHEPIDPRLAAYIAAEACSGLHAAHELESAAGEPLDLVHRDVSPHNVFVTYDGKIKIIDFGIAKSAERITQTRTGELKGKFEYMSPEQCTAKPVDRRSDVFALGAVLYELTTGRRLFKRPSELLTLKAIAEGPIIPPRALVEDYPEGLQAIVLRALARDPAARYQSAAEMRRELKEFMVREANPIAVPEEALGALMERLFEERQREKSELVSRASETSDVGELPVPEVDLDYAVPVLDPEDVESFTHTGKVPIHLVRSGSGRLASGGITTGHTRMLVAALVALAAVGVAWMLLGRPREKAADPRDTPALAAEQVPARPIAPMPSAVDPASGDDALGPGRATAPPSAPAPLEAPPREAEAHEVESSALPSATDRPAATGRAVRRPARPAPSPGAAAEDAAEVAPPSNAEPATTPPQGFRKFD